MKDFTLEKVNELLEQIKGLKIKEASLFRKRLQKEKHRLTARPRPQRIDIGKANKNRSVKLQRYWRYIRLIRDNFPDLTVSMIRKQLHQRQQGQQTEIPDVIWQNPSP